MHKRAFSVFLCLLLATNSVSGQTKGFKVVLNDGREFLAKGIEESPNIVVLRLETGEMIIQTSNIKKITQIDFDAEKKIEMEKRQKAIRERELALKKWAAEHPGAARELELQRWGSEYPEEAMKQASEVTRIQDLQKDGEKAETATETDVQDQSPYDYQVIFVSDGDATIVGTMNSFREEGWELYKQKRVFRTSGDQYIRGTELKFRKLKLK